ncbi:MAG: hypothetical protein ACLRZ2_03335 [Veillonella sp.]
MKLLLILWLNGRYPLYGGGTPTVLGTDFHQGHKQLSILVPEGHEFTVEAGRPDSVNPTKLRSLDLGVNRIIIVHKRCKMIFCVALGVDIVRMILMSCYNM